MTHTLSIMAWVLEAAYDLLGAHKDQTEMMLHDWIDTHHLPTDLHVVSRNAGSEDPEHLDSIYLSWEATGEQVNELAVRIGGAYDVPVLVRRTELLLITKLDAQTRQPTGEFSIIEVDQAEPRRRWEAGGRDVN